MANICVSPQIVCLFQGPHCYVSSSWYGHPEVPTWNYISVEVKGEVSFIDDETLIYDHLDALVKKYEANNQTHLKLQNLPYDVVWEQMKGLVAFDIKISEVNAAYKLSQNRNTHDFQEIVTQLDAKNEWGSLAVAKEMKKICPYQS